MKAKRFLALLLTAVMLLGLMPTAMFPVSAAEDAPNEEVVEEEYPKDAEYDFTIPGSTIRFLDKDGVLMTEEEGWDYEYVVKTWHVFMYRATKSNLKLGYSPAGKLFLPHRVYEGDTADLLYVKDNTMFRVTATKDPEQTFDGSQILKTVSLNATNGTVTLAYAPVFAETPFGYKYMGATDENGSFSVNTTTGEFTLWISSNAGYILKKTVTVTDATTEISFGDEINNAVEIDITARSETYEKASGYMVALGKPNESIPENMLTTSFISPDKTVFVTPGAYSIACGIWVQNQYYASSSSSNNYRDYGGLWIDLANDTTIRQKTTYDFSLADFEVNFEIQDAYKQDSYGMDDRIALRLNAEHPDGYILAARAQRALYGEVVDVTVGENQYPYTFCQDAFTAYSDEIKVYKKGDESNAVKGGDIGLSESGLTLSLFGETENEYIVKCYPSWNSKAFPWLFPKDVWYSTTFKTKSLEGIYKTFESNQSFNLYYFDENGVMSQAVSDYRDGKRFYYIPATVQNGDYLLAVDWTSDSQCNSVLQYNVIPVSDELFANGYTFVEKSNLSQVNIVVANGENDETRYDTTFALIIAAGNREFKLSCAGYSELLIPYGEYIIEVHATSDQFDDNYNLLSSNVILYSEKRTLSEAACTINVDYSAYKSFVVDASAFPVVEDMENYKKQLTLHYADGSVINVNWEAAPATLYCATLPEYATGEMYYYAHQEMVPFSPYVTIERFEIEEGKTYQFDFRPAAIEMTGSTTFESNENTVLTYKVTDGFGNVLPDIWNLLNGVVHNPLNSREYPFRDENGNPVSHQYTVDVYFRVKGESGYQRMSFTDFSKAELGILAAGEYEGYLEINFDTYLDEYAVEYPMEKGVIYDEWGWGEFISVYDNVSRILHGVLHNDFAFTVVDQTHTCDFGAWVDDIVTDTHTRTCKDPECGKTETKPHDWDDGVQNGTPTCTEGATVTYTCAGCGKVKTENVDPLNHDWSEWTDDGEDASTDTHSRTCMRDGCGATESESHGWSRWVKIDERTHKKSCFICDGTRTAAHHFDDGVVTEEATHLETGVMTFTCTDGCGYYYTEDIPKTAEHQWGEWLNNNNNGTHTRYCRCGASETKDCTYDAGVVTTRPTCDATGTMTYTCTACNATKTETIEAAHTFDVVDGNYVCSVCGHSEPTAETLTIAEAIALGNSMENETYTVHKYRVTGVVTEVSDTQYGNMRITDGKGNTLTIYGTYSADGTVRYDAMDVKPAAGDTVTVYGVIGQDNGTAQMKSGWLMEHTVKPVDQWNITLKEDLNANFYMNLNADDRVQVTVGEEVVTYNAADLQTTEDGKYIVTVEMAAAQMMDEITIWIVDSNAAPEKYTIRQYADTVLADNTKSAYHALVKEMLNYGAMAQVYFNYNAANPANADITGFGTADVTEATYEKTIYEGAVDGISFYSASLVYGSKVAVRLYFKVLSGSIEDYTFSNSTDNLTAVAKGDYYYIEFANITPDKWNEVVNLYVIKGNEYIHVQYSPLSYMVRMSSKATSGEALKNLLKAMYNYHLAAKNLVVTE